MQKMRHDNTKKTHQWRKNPRRFAPKSRLGCKTCKIRRVKCDLSTPSCSKCHSTGRTCDGYTQIPLVSNSEIKSSDCQLKSSNGGEWLTSYHPPTNISTHRPEQPQSRLHGLIFQNLRPFMILPANSSAETQAMLFFENTSIKYLNEYHHCESWRKALMIFSQTVPSVRHAAIALSLLHRDYLQRDPNDLRRPQLFNNCQEDDGPLLHYNRAIRYLLQQDNGDSIETAAITLLVCYLFTCFDQLAGNHVQAMKHLRGGVELSRNIQNAIPNVDDTHDAVKPSDIRQLVSQVSRQIHRLDMQAVTFLVDWDPSDMQDTTLFYLSESEGAFLSLNQAADQLQILVARVMKLRNAEQELSLNGNMPPPPSSLKNIVLGQLKTWLDLFENISQQGSRYQTDPEAYPLKSLLRLQYTVTWILLSSYGAGNEMEYDKFLPEFQECVVMADNVATAHSRYAGSSKPTFTPEIGILPVLYIIGVKCRHVLVRRKVLNILRRQPVREAIWDSISTARLIERVIEIEEGGFERGNFIKGMEEIAVWQRIEALTWVQVESGDSAPRLDIVYTFCAREGLHSDSLMF